MSFYSANKNFIRNKLYSEMKGLSDKEKLDKYQNIKAETRKRLQVTYLESNNLYAFYEEAFEYLSFFEHEFLIINLFFENDCNRIFNYLKFGKLTELKINKQFLFSYKFINFMNKCSSEDEVTDFLKFELTELLSLNPDDWDYLNTNRNSIVKKFAAWLVFSNKDSVNTKENNYYYLLFCKLWNHNDRFLENFNEKAIVFYNEVNRKFHELLDNEVYVDLSKIDSDIRMVVGDMFFKELNYYPIIDNKTDASNGYIFQRKKLKENMNLSKILCKSYIKESFISIFEMIIGNDNEFTNKLQKELNTKLNRLDVPNNNEIMEIINLNLDDRQAIVRNEFLKRLYIF